MTLICGVAKQSARADAFRIPYQGAAAAGQGDAFAAQADDASALYYNPAGLTQLKGFNAYVGVNLVGGGTQFKNQSGKEYHADFGGDVGFPPPSNLYLVGKLSDLGFHTLDRLTLGVGLTSNYGLATRWQGITPFSSVITRARLPMLTIKPTLACAVNDMVSLGFGVDIYTFASFIGAGGYETRNLLASGLGTELNGDGTVVGYNGSILLTPFRNEGGKPLLNFGFVYRTGVRLGMKGFYSVNNRAIADAQFAFELPEVFSGGIAGWPIRDHEHEWKLEYDMEHIGWDAAKNLNVKLSGMPVSVSPQYWHSSYTASFGTEFKWLQPSAMPDWTIALRTGYQHSSTPVPDASFTPALTDADWNKFTLGLGFGCKEKGKFLGLIECGDSQGKRFTAESLGVDLAFQAFFYDTRNVRGNIQSSVNGRYQTTAFVGSISFNLNY